MNPLELWQRLSTPEKIAVGAALVGIAIFAYVQYNKNQSSNAATSPNVTTAGSGATTISQLLTALGTDGSTATQDTTSGTVAPAPATTARLNAQLPVAVSPAVSNNAPTPQPAATARYVTVQPWAAGSSGDTTLGNIAANHGVAGGALALAKLNPQITNVNSVYPGEQIRIA